VPVRFLSDEWAEELQTRLNASESFRKGLASATATVLQVISTPEGERRYWIRVDGGRIAMGSGDAPGADATIAQDYDTAVALARGELNAVAAYMTGKIKISGNLMTLMGLQGALSELPRVMQDMDVDY
jgi:putative sterol carrier protein